MALVALLCFASVPSFGQEKASSTDELLKQATAAYQARHYSESVSLWKRALPSVEDTDRAGVEYNLACSQALAGDPGAAFGTLFAAVEDGYSDRKNTEGDQDLVSLHADPRWDVLLGRMAQQDARWGDAAFATPNAPNLPDADKLAGLAELWAQAKFGFANFWHVPQLRWDETYRDYIPRVLATHSTAEYYDVLQRFYALLEDGHSRVYSPDMVVGAVDRLPLRTRLVDSRLLVVGSRNPAADLQGLRIGDEIVMIDGEPAVSWAQRHVEPLVSASTRQDREARTYEYVPFLAPIGTSFRLVTQTPFGRQSTHVFTVEKTTEVHKPPFELRLLPGNIAYVALNGFDDDTAAKEWMRHWPEIQHAKAIVLDLRENGGGSDSVGYSILATLVEKPTPKELSRSTRWVASYHAWNKPQTPVRFPREAIEPDSAHHFGGPVVMLTSARTYSAAEDMAVVFKQSRRGNIVGEPTGGSSGQPLSFKLPGGGMAQICTKHDSFADGREFVGVGVQPDIEAHLTRADLVGGKDRVLQTALESLQSK